MALCGAAALAAPAQATDPQWGRWAGERVLGTSLDLQLRGGGDAAAGLAALAALDEFARLDAILSTWRGDSEIALLHDKRRLAASPDLYAVISACEAWRARTRGAFHAARGVAAHESGVRLDPPTRSVALEEGVFLDIDALAKGYAIDRAFAAARRAAPQARALLINLGGDMRVWSDPALAPWRLNIADPRARFDNAPPLQSLALHNGALAASGLGHRSAAAPIRDPRKDEIVADVALSAAIAANAMEADALATSIAVLGDAQSGALMAENPNWGGLLVNRAGEARALGAWNGEQVGACQAGWPDGRRLSISLEIPERNAADYKRPYVVVWITDEARNLVRTLLVLGDEPRWRENNYIFWRRVERMDAEAIAAMARPTRAPGRYDVVWDGRTETGELAPRGRYTLNIEASREHGGHSFVRVPLDLSADRLDLSADAVQELGPTRVAFGRPR